MTDSDDSQRTTKVNRFEKKRKKPKPRSWHASTFLSSNNPRPPRSIQPNRNGKVYLVQVMVCCSLRNLTIVIVEDHDDTRSFLAQFLSNQGAEVFASVDAASALQAVQRQRPDLVLSDICLPDRNGFQLLRDIRALGPENGGAVPVIAMTAFGSSVDRDHTTAAGFERCLDKPFGPEELLEAVQKSLDGDGERERN
jgi:CheY-like chemotaxis protein